MTNITFINTVLKTSLEIIHFSFTTGSRRQIKRYVITGMNNTIKGFRSNAFIKLP